MKQAFPRRTRIPLLFIGGIGLPSLLLGYLAFRGVKNDQALIEKERIEEHRQLAGRVVQAVDEQFMRLERAVHDILTAKGEDGLRGLVPELRAFQEKHSLVEAVFIFERPANTDFPCSPLLYRPRAGRFAADGSSSGQARSRFVEEGERLEFRENAPAEALSFYRQALKETSNPRGRAEVLIRIARLQKKLGRLREALQTYRTISESYDQIRTGTGPPAGLAARLESGPVFHDLGDPAAALGALLGLYEELLDGRWILDKGEFDFAVRRTKDLVGGLLARESPAKNAGGSTDGYRALEDREKRERARTERYLLFQSDAPRALRLRGPASRERPAQGPVRFSLEAGAERFLVCLVPLSEGESGDDRIWGLTLSAERLLATLLQTELESVRPEGRTGWALQDRDGTVLAASSPAPGGTLTVEAGFKDGFPDWTLQLYKPDVRLPEALLTSRRGGYFAMFLLIAGILAFGFILTLLSITREVELSRMKSDFVSTVSHEFKSPLTSIRQIAEMLATDRVPSEERRQRYYEVLLEQSERLSLLTDNVLSFARMEEGKRTFAVEDVNVAELLDDVVSPLRDRVRHEGFGVELKVEEALPPVRADRAALAQVISNLVDNAVKYSGASRRVEVEAFGKDDALLITVRDFGIGIPKEEQARIFDRFFRGGDELTRTVKGSGLGLTLVKQIVEAHGGTVRVDSEPGKGSRFTVRLPYQQHKGSQGWPES